MEVALPSLGSGAWASGFKFGILGIGASGLRTMPGFQSSWFSDWRWCSVWSELQAKLRGLSTKLSRAPALSQAAASCQYFPAPVLASAKPRKLWVGSTTPPLPEDLADFGVMALGFKTWICGFRVGRSSTSKCPSA